MIRIRITGPAGQIFYTSSLDTINATPGMLRRFVWAGLRSLVEVHLKTPPALTTKLEIEVQRLSNRDDEFSFKTKKPEGFERYRHER